MPQQDRLLVTLPPDVRQWLKKTSDYYGGSQSSEIVRAIRVQMERGQDKGQATPRRNKQQRRMTAGV